MSTQNFLPSHIAGPYCPLQLVNDKWLRRVRVVTAAVVLYELNTYYSHLSWIGHEEAMAQSMHNAAAAVGEVDEPAEYPAHNPLTAAGSFGISVVMNRVHELTQDRRSYTLSRRDGSAIGACLVQLLFALANDDRALAVVARYKRTRYIGTPSDLDVERVAEVRKYIRRITKRTEEFSDYFVCGNLTTPLMSRVYKTDGYTWSDPIPVLEFPFEETE